MQIYVELALIENFCMDFSLLFIAKAATKNPARYLRLVIASALGACFAVVFPLFNLNGYAAIPVKLAAGFVLCAVAGKFQSFKGYLKFAALFTGGTFLLGGALIAIFSLAGLDYKEGGGYLISSVPIGIPLFFAIVLAIIIRTIRKRVVANKNISAYCKIFKGGESVVCTAFYDSGNKVYFDGAPVSIVPDYIAKKLCNVECIKSSVDIHTVSGKGKIKVFTADKVEIDDGKAVVMRQNVVFGVSPRHINKIVLHPDLSEVN